MNHNNEQNLPDFLVIGAGLAGLSAARRLVSRGASVQVVDKGRGVGGRASTKRIGAARLDHGAQFFTVRSAPFAEIVEQGLSSGWIREWFRSLPEWRAGSIHERPASHPRYTCPDGMSALPKFLATGLDVSTGIEIVDLERTEGLYRATDRTGRRFAAPAVLLNLPPAQLLSLAAALLPSRVAQRIASVEMEPCWALLALLERDLSVPWPALELAEHPVFSWIARDHTRRGEGLSPALVAHAGANWSLAHLERERDEVTSVLSEALHELLGTFGLVLGESQSHRWRYAKPKSALGEPFFWDPELRVGACGDWCEGGRVEGAFLSGFRLAEACGSP